MTPYRGLSAESVEWPHFGCSGLFVLLSVLGMSPAKHCSDRRREVLPIRLDGTGFACFVGLNCPLDVKNENLRSVHFRQPSLSGLGGLPVVGCWPSFTPLKCRG